ncbi:MAG: cytochrome b/b6 domain-containing protein [Alphaproteobacteria bacterium]|nr:cytochrome b/b6 domain-containing protein [Alphaproteobacteria bacterium]
MRQIKSLERGIDEMSQATPAKPTPAKRSSSGSVPTWDLPTRIFHCLLVVLVAGSWASMEYAESLSDPLLKWHRWCGLVVLTLLVWRLIWGFIGNPTSRFTNFIPAPTTVATYATAVLRGNEPKYLGHNPLGALMIIALIATLFTQAALGLFAVEHNDLTAGPLYLFLSEQSRKLATGWHRFLFNTLIFWFIAAHIAANLYYALIRKDPLIKAMIIGRKPDASYVDQASNDRNTNPARDVEGARFLSTGATMLRATAALVASAVIVFGGIWAVGGKFLQMQMRFFW